VVSASGGEGAPARIGVFLCHCGTNVSDAVDVGAVAAAAARLPGVALVREGGFLCADAGQRQLRELVAAERLTGVVVAGCTPQLHEPTFRRAVREAGLNPHLLQIANVREQVAWVTPDRAAATAKAAAVVAAAVARVSRQAALEPREVPVTPAALVVGAGIAGIEAALRIADAGTPVLLVERSTAIGGHLALLARTYPTLDCSACVVVPKMADAAAHPRITVLTGTTVEAAGGSVGAFRVRLRTAPRHVDAARCTGCGLCVERCPVVGVPAEADAGIGTRSAAHFPFPQAVPWVPVIDRASCVRLGEPGCRLCEEVCPAGAVDLAEDGSTREVEAGAVVLATGFRLFDPARAPEYGFGRWPNVVTSLQLERMLHPSGPTGGRVLLANGRPPRSVALLHCVGSRDRRYNRHCSRVCCSTALKLALLVRRATGARVHQFYVDMRASGKHAEEFYEQAQRAGVTFVQGRGTEVACRGGTLMVKAEDGLLGRQVVLPVDMVVLAAGMEPHADAAALANRFGVACGEQGFFAERHMKFAPVETAVEGVFLAGACQGPKDVPESVAQGGAAAAAVLELMALGTVSVVPTLAEVDPARCSGCGLCVPACPYGAVALGGEAGREAARVSEELCRGCGACVAACPVGAIAQQGFTGGQLAAEVRGAVGAAPPDAPAPQ